ncbi:MAG: ABC transporter substrate-binding protein [Anaerolineae bacterium]|nr:ABC transporter substrate-binding protein [Anaerolineae bacterium]
MRHIPYFFISILALLLAACSFGGQPTEDTTLKMGLLPILDVLPFYVAQDKGYFEAEGIQVELVPVKSAQEQSALIQANEIDGAMTDLQNVALFNRETPQLKIISLARRAYPEYPHFRIVAAPGFEVNGPEDLAGVPIGISQNTIIEYLADRLLSEWGLPADGMTIEEVSAIPVRFEMLMEGQLKAALLPEPMGEAALAGGATLVVDDTQFPQYSQSILAFTTDSLAKQPNTVKAFLRAWNKAVASINQNPNAYRDVLIENTRVPPSIQGTFNIPKYPAGEITTEAEWNDVIIWMQEKDLLDGPVPYEDSVDKSFLE